MNEYAWGIGVGILIIAASVGRAVAAVLGAHARRIDRTPATTADPARGELVEDLQRRVADLEERVDFAERLLAKQRDGERLPSPRS